MKKFIIQVVLLLLVIGGSLIFFNPNNKGGRVELPFLPHPPKTATLEINSHLIKAEVADTPSKRSKGLGGKTSLEQDEGMLFIFPNADKHPFWMKGLSFPLDFIWIKEDKVVDILENIQPPKEGEPDASLPIYSSKEAADKVLELQAGTVKRLDIKIGDTVLID